jgi:hypothetical protein
MVLFWISCNLYVDEDGHFYRVDYRRVSERTFVREEPVRIGDGDILRRGSSGMGAQSALHNERTKQSV